MSSTRSRHLLHLIRANRLGELVALLLLGALILSVGLLAGAYQLVRAFGVGPLVAVAAVAMFGVLGVIAAAVLWADYRVLEHVDLPRLVGTDVRTTTVATADGALLHVEVEGPADADTTVIFCHGWMVEQDAWRDQRHALQGSAVRRVFYDMRGHGRSDWQPIHRDHLGVRQLAHDLELVVDAVAPQGRLVLVGHSCGGMTIMSAAATRPHLFGRVSGVLLCATSAGGLEGTMTLGMPKWLGPVRVVCRRYASATLLLLGLLPRPLVQVVGMTPWALSARFLALTKGVDPRIVAHTTRMLWDTHLRIAGETLHHVMTHDERRDFSRVLAGIPTTIVTGRGDRLVPPADQHATHALLPGARMVELPDTGHMVATERPADVNRELLALLPDSSAVAGGPNDLASTGGARLGTA